MTALEFLAQWAKENPQLSESRKEWHTTLLGIVRMNDTDEAVEALDQFTQDTILPIWYVDVILDVRNLLRPPEPFVVPDTIEDVEPEAVTANKP